MRRPVPLLIAAATLVFASCGGGDETDEHDERSPRRTRSPSSTAADDDNDERADLTARDVDDRAGGRGRGRHFGAGAADRCRGRDRGGLHRLAARGDDLRRAADRRLRRDGVRIARGCIAGEKPGALAESVEIKELDDDGAEATVVPTGGPYDGVEVEVKLVDDGGIRVDSLEADVPAGP